MPAVASLRTASSRRSGRGARGSSSRASFSSSVVMVMLTLEHVAARDLAQQIQIAHHQVATWW